MNRFYFPDSLAGPEVELRGAEAHHLMRVLRLEIGDDVTLFDGRGTSAKARIARLGKRAVELSIIDRAAAVESPQTPVTLATAVPKGERFRWLVEKATELGVSRLIPLRTARSVVNPGQSKLEKIRQTVIAACKQSGRDHLMQIDAASTWLEFVDRESARGRIYVAHPGPSGGRHQGSEVRDQRSAVRDQRSGFDSPGVLNEARRERWSLVVAVGPEGGLTDNEIAHALSRGAQLVALGPHILRIETAALAMAVLASPGRWAGEG